ncbi:MAG: hypothetical protein WC050_02810 [Candidatus Paceibacterota bacterium]
MMDTVSGSFSSQDATMATLSFVNTFLNACIGLLITVAVVTFFSYLLCWVFAKANSELSTEGRRGATRAFIVLFLMINIWFIIRLLDAIVGFSNTLAYEVFFFSFLLLGFWSLFGMGDAFMRLLARALDGILDALVFVVRRAGGQGESALSSWLLKVDQKTLRFCMLVILALCITPFSFIVYPEPTQKAASQTAPAYTFEVQHEPGDSAVKDNTYENTRYGIAIQFPKDWEVTAATSTEGLVLASNKERTLVAQLNAGSYGFSSANSADPFLDTMWAVQKNMLGDAARNSGGVISSSMSTYKEVGSAPAALLIINAYWPVHGTFTSCYHYYYIFGKGPVFYTIEFNTCAQEMLNEQTGKTIESILDTIKIASTDGFLD